MTPEPHSPSDEERAAQALIAAAGKILAGEHPDISADFIAAMFARAVPEDLMRYDARELAALAADAWTLLAGHKPGTGSVRLASPSTSAAHERLKAMSVIEVVNDDMPFLVDSVMGVIADRGFDVQFAVHPIFAVERDPEGHLVAFKGARAAGPGERRESYIHIHVPRIDDEERRRDVIKAIDAALADIRVSVQDWRAMLDRVERGFAGGEFIIAQAEEGEVVA